MKIKLLFIIYLLVCSCMQSIDAPTDKVFEINLDLNEISLINSDYKKNPEGFPLYTKTVDDTIFIYGLKSEGKIDYKKSIFSVTEDFTLDEFIIKRQFTLIDTIQKNNKKYYTIKSHESLKFDIRFDSNRQKVFVKFMYPR